MEFACFAECKKLKNIVIAEGVSAMDKSCFANCKKLKKVELPTTLKSIGEICFFGCSNVTVTIKGKITKCDVYAFYKVRNCKIVLKTAAAKKGKKVLAKALKKGKELGNTGFYESKNLKLQVSEGKKVQVTYDLDMFSLYGGFNSHLQVQESVKVIKPVTWIRKVKGLSEVSNKLKG